MIDKTEYTGKLEDIIGNGTYSKVKKNLTMKTERKLTQVLKKTKKTKNRDQFLNKTYMLLSESN